MKKDIKSLTKELKALTQKTAKNVKALEKLDKDQVKPKYSSTNSRQQRHTKQKWIRIYLAPRFQGIKRQNLRTI